jgi:hypothetical protein
MKAGLQIAFYFIDGIRNELRVQKLNGIINVGLVRLKMLELLTILNGDMG